MTAASLRATLTAVGVNCLPTTTVPCRGCGRPGPPQCIACARRRGTTTARGYGTAHRKLRASWAARIDAGERPPCRRCHDPIEAGDPFDLGHDETRSSSWPEHRACNRGTNRKAEP